MTVDRPARVMETELNCSARCDSSLCLITPGVSRQRGHDVLQRLCGLIKLDADAPGHRLSPVLTAVMWTLLSCGILSSFCFLLFTMRFRNNRIVKMSSPNLNVLTLCGSVLTYMSGFLFAVDHRVFSQGAVSPALLQVRIWTLCVGSTLVFGPILGKTWRLYRVFTQRVPDKRVIIRDIQLIGMVFLLILVDVTILTVWSFTDPVRCSRSLAAVVKVMSGRGSSSLSLLDTCSSLYSDIWIILVAAQKGCLLFYGTYLAGLTSNVSHPPVNQSPAIITAVTLVTLSSALVVPVSIFFPDWPNVVYSVVAGSILVCTLATNCMLFVPQLTQWRQFEEDQNNPSQMAKFFSSPSKSQPSVYSQDEIYFLLGENNSMKKLLSEKNAVIDGLQEQVNSAKDKLLRLMTESRPSEDQDVGPCTSYLNSSSTQTTDLLMEDASSSSLPQKDTPLRTSLGFASSKSSPVFVSPFGASLDRPSVLSSPPPPPPPVSQSLPGDTYMNEAHTDYLKTNGNQERKDSTADNEPPTPCTFPARTAEEAIDFVTSLQTRRRHNLSNLNTILEPGNLRLQTKPTGFVSSEQLQEILQELSVDAVLETTLRSPSSTSRTPSHLKPSLMSPLLLQPPRNPQPPILFRYPSVSPSMMRKRRPPFRSSRRGPGPPCVHVHPHVPGCRKAEDIAELQPLESGTLCPTPLEDPSSDPEVGKEAEGEKDGLSECQQCASGVQKASALPELDESNCERKRLDKHVRDSSGYWDSDSSSSTDYCYYHRPYCDSCVQRGSLLSSDSSSDSSDGEYEDYISLYPSTRPVVFKEDLKPTFV